jgi:hypothetical protein
VPATDQSGVDAVLNSIASAISGSATAAGQQARRKVAAFVYGFLHSQMLETYDYQHENVTRFLISDNAVDIETERKKPYAQVYARVTDVWTRTDRFGKDEDTIRADAFLGMGNDEWIGSRVGIDLGDNYGHGKDSPWFLVATLTPEELDFHRTRGGIWTSLTIIERDPLVDDRFQVDMKWNFNGLTGAQLTATMAANPVDHKWTDASATLIGDVTLVKHYKINAVLR